MRMESIIESHRLTIATEKKKKEEETSKDNTMLHSFSLLITSIILYYIYINRISLHWNLNYINRLTISISNKTCIISFIEEKNNKSNRVELC
jgi:hypothetical protein